MTKMNELERCRTKVGDGMCGRQREHDPELECRLPTAMECRLWIALDLSRNEAVFYKSKMEEFWEKLKKLDPKACVDP